MGVNVLWPFETIQNVDPWLKKEYVREHTRATMFRRNFDRTILSELRIEVSFWVCRIWMKNNWERRNFARDEITERVAAGMVVIGINGRDFWKQISRRWRRWTSNVTRQYRKRRNDIDVASAPARGPPTTLFCVVRTTRTKFWTMSR